MPKEQNNIDVLISLEDESLLPHYASDLAAGADAKACLTDPIVIKPGESALIPTGLRISIPEGFELQVRPRSGLALKNQITVLNSPGTIDADYRGEIGIILINHGKSNFIVTPGMRIAQFIFAPVVQANFRIVARNELSETMRGINGFGHTGTH